MYEENIKQVFVCICHYPYRLSCVTCFEGDNFISTNFYYSFVARSLPRIAPINKLYEWQVCHSGQHFFGIFSKTS